VNQSLDIKSVLRSVMHKILEIFSFDAARTRLLSEDGKELRLLAMPGHTSIAFSGMEHQPASWVTGAGRRNSLAWRKRYGS